MPSTARQASPKASPSPGAVLLLTDGTVCTGLVVNDEDIRGHTQKVQATGAERKIGRAGRRLTAR